MLDAKQRAEIDQSMAAMVELLPPMWRGLYTTSLDQGFTETESFALLKVYILSQGPHGPQIE